MGRKHNERNVCPHIEVNTVKDLENKEELLIGALLEDHQCVTGRSDDTLIDMIPEEPVCCFVRHGTLKDTVASSAIFEPVALREHLP